MKIYYFILLTKSYYLTCTKPFISVINFYQHIKHGGYGMIERRTIKKNARRQVKSNFIMLAAVMIVSEIIANMVLLNDALYYAGINLPDLAVKSMTIMGFLLSGLMAFGTARIGLKTVNDQTFKFSELFIGLRIYLKILGLYVVTTVFIFIGTMFFVIPGIIMWLNFSQVYYILAEDEDKSIFSCLVESTKMMQGHKLELLYLELSFIGWILLSILTLGLGLLWVDPYLNITFANFHMKLKEISESSNVNTDNIF